GVRTTTSRGARQRAARPAPARGWGAALVTGENLGAEYFERLYADNGDPWDFAGRWYEQRKRMVTLGSLPRPRFRRAFEPGCSTGLLTVGLAARCDELVAWDVSEAAVRTTRRRLARELGVRVERGQVPEQWPDGPFDLIVLS